MLSFPDSLCLQVFNNSTRFINLQPTLQQFSVVFSWFPVCVRMFIPCSALLFTGTHSQLPKWSQLSTGTEVVLWVFETAETVARKWQEGSSVGGSTFQQIDLSWSYKGFLHGWVTYHPDSTMWTYCFVFILVKWRTLSVHLSLLASVIVRIAQRKCIAVFRSGLPFSCPCSHNQSAACDPGSLKEQVARLCVWGSVCVCEKWDPIRFRIFLLKSVLLVV